MARKSASKSGGEKQTTRKAAQEEKVGGDPQAAANFGGKGDFGIPVSKARPGQQTDAGAMEVDGRPLGTKMPPRSGEGLRDTGVGSPASGPGSGSGGDLDPDIIGLGTGGGVAINAGEHRTTGPDITETAIDSAAGGGAAKGENNLPPGTHGAGDPVQGTTIDRGDREVRLGRGDTGAIRAADDDLPGTASSGDRSSGEDVDDREAQGAQNE